ncbi:MAG: hypothetical protein LUQ31_01570 [Methanoregula sp.]|nr:hypothetical protein [Methanoregula sp.]
MLCTGVSGMATIKAKVIDDFHLELERGIPVKSGEVFVKIIEKKPVASLRGAWGYDVDSADFVENLRTSKRIEPV